MNLKYFLNKINNKKVVYKRRTIIPDYDWLCMVLCSVILVLFLGAIGLWVFTFVSSGSLWRVEKLPEVKEYRLNKKDLDMFLQYTNDRSEKFNVLNNKTESTKNPFL